MSPATKPKRARGGEGRLKEGTARPIGISEDLPRGAQKRVMANKQAALELDSASIRRHLQG